ncbi:MAG: TIGR01459 family HAD-type hydrolase, partial [Marinosulfonomonas sp.]|nr:TIGR01459 family HAD-type hydrolase [Marinosulfonomonas sp.]
MSNQTDEQWAFDAYEGVRARLPLPGFARQWRTADTLADIAQDFDVFLLDAFGVLNIGETAIEGAAERIRDLRDAGKRVMVVSNAAGYPKRILMERYRRLGFDFAPGDIVTSRDALLSELATRAPMRWGIMASQRFGMEELEHLDCHFLTEDPASYEAAKGFLLIGSAEWTQERQELLIEATRQNPRP